MSTSETGSFSFDSIGVSLFENADATSHITNNKESMLEALEKGLQGLDAYQRNVVIADHQENAQVIANAGSGKTHTLIYKALTLVLKHNVPAPKIIMISFTNKSSKEIRDRYLQFFIDNLPPECIDTLCLPQISTIHSLGFTILFKTIGSRLTLMTDGKSKRFIREAMKEIMDLPKIPQDEVNRVKYAIEQMMGYNEGYLFGIPKLTANYECYGVWSYEDLYDNDPDTLERAFHFSNTAHQLRLMTPNQAEFEAQALNKEFHENLREHYAQLAGLSVGMFEKVYLKFLDGKYTSSIGDFADMQAAPLYYYFQHPEALPYLWAKYEHIFVDEAQDLDSLNLALAIHCDRQSYESLKWFPERLYKDKVDNYVEWMSKGTMAAHQDNPDEASMFRDSIKSLISQRAQQMQQPTYIQEASRNPFDLSSYTDESNPF